MAFCTRTSGKFSEKLTKFLTVFLIRITAKPLTQRLFLFQPRSSTQKTPLVFFWFPCYNNFVSGNKSYPDDFVAAPFRQITPINTYT